MAETERKKLAALYTRVSYYNHHGDNLDDQLEACCEYADQRDYNVVTELTEDDRGASGASSDLPALNRTLDLARSGRIDVLVKCELDHFVRGLANDVNVEYVLVEPDDTPEGQLTKHVRAIIAEYEREKISERIRRGRYCAARHGSVMIASNPPPARSWCRLTPSSTALYSQERRRSVRVRSARHRAISTLNTQDSHILRKRRHRRHENCTRIGSRSCNQATRPVSTRCT